MPFEYRDQVAFVYVNKFGKHIEIERPRKIFGNIIHDSFDDFIA